jgi:hypothetical protein
MYRRWFLLQGHSGSITHTTITGDFWLDVFFLVAIVVICFFGSVTGSVTGSGVDFPF